MDFIAVSSIWSGLADIMNGWAHTILLWIDSVAYYFISVMYDIFIKISQVRLFSNEFLDSFSRRIYVFMGIVMLFFLAYSLLKAIVDPEQLAKGDKSVAKMVPNLIISLVIIGVLPTVFDYMYDLQDFILKKNVVGSLVFGTSGDSLDAGKFGNYLSVTVMSAFINSEASYEGNSQLRQVESSSNITWEEYQSLIYTDGKLGHYMELTNFGENIANGEMTYKIVFSTVCAFILLYLLLTFCLDLGLRAVKLAFLQLIAPVPVVMRALPNGKKTFDSWFKNLATAYFEVFIRVFIMYMIALMISQMHNIDWGTDPIIFVIVIMGFFLFLKEAPQLLSDVLGLPKGNLKLGFKDFKEKLKGGGAFVGGAALGGALTAGVRNAYNAKGKFDNAKGFGKLGALGGGILSTVAGAGSGMFRAGKAGVGVDSLGKMKQAAGTGAKAATDARERRSVYTAAHGGAVGSMFGHMSDAGTSFKGWYTGEKQYYSDNAIAEVDYYDDIFNANKNMDDLYAQVDTKYAGLKAEEDRLKVLEEIDPTQIDMVTGKSAAKARQDATTALEKSRSNTIKGDAQAAAYRLREIYKQALKDKDYAKKANLDVDKIAKLANKLNLNSSNQMVDENGKVYDASMSRILEDMYNQNDIYINNPIANGSQKFKGLSDIKKNVGPAKTTVTNSVAYGEMKRQKDAESKNTAGNADSKK